ncbi:serine protein kinase RIO [Candidatus Woesearchaeota archaeon]|nr:MAG: serine protein kinase RIO [Candidatus Woesearchaeota archaeon]
MPRMGTVHKEKYKTFKDVFDNFTERNLFKLQSQGFFDELGSPVSIGKEANVFTVVCGDETRVLKIYRLQTCDFNKMYEFIRRDPRYVAIKRKRREVIFAWAQREYRNLLKAREGGVRVPTPITVLYNILVLEFIGDSNGAAPRLKDKKPLNPERFFLDLREEVRKLYLAGLVHGDLSGFNVLNHDERPVLIDFSQATPVDSRIAEEYLLRDARNVCKLFCKWGVECDKDEFVEYVRS